jgi:transposase-like protein
VADGGLGFWAALPKVFPATGEQRCWMHGSTARLSSPKSELAEVKTANVLNKMPKSSQGKARRMLHDIYLAETKEAAGTYRFRGRPIDQKRPSPCRPHRLPFSSNRLSTGPSLAIYS